MMMSDPRRVLAVVLVGHALASGALAQGTANPLVVLDNDYVRVTKDAAPCATAVAGRCEDRVLVAMGAIELKAGDAPRAMKRGDVAIFKAGESYQAPAGAYYEVAIKPGHPPVKAPPELISAPKNLLVFEGAKFFIYEERLDPGDTRARHSHSQRVEIRLNQGPMLQQQVWRDGQVSYMEPGIVNWREPVIHEVTNVGDLPLRNFILEFIPERRE
jgi:quercetin dioxygenase-like cupin family protein